MEIFNIPVRNEKENLNQIGSKVSLGSKAGSFVSVPCTNETIKKVESPRFDTNADKIADRDYIVNFIRQKRLRDQRLKSASKSPVTSTL
jgi:hypothetical protein